MLQTMIQFYLAVGFTIASLAFAVMTFVPLDVMYLTSSSDAVDEVRSVLNHLKRHPLQLLSFVLALIIIGPLLLIRSDPRRDALPLILVFSLSALTFYASR